MNRLPLAVVVAVTLWETRVLPQSNIFRARVEAVRVDALVTDNNGRPVQGLGIGDFEIADNGAPQPITYFSVDRLPLNLILTLDLSHSVAGPALDRLRDASRTALTGLHGEDRAALLTFGDALRLRSPLTSDLDKVGRALNEGSGNGLTSLIDASYAALWVAQGDAGRALAIIFSDGIDTVSWMRASRVLESARRSDLVVYGVTLASSGDDEFLKDLTETSGGRLFALDSNDRLADTFGAILDEFRQRYVLSFTPSSTTSGWHELNVRVKGRRAKVISRRGYLAGAS